MSQSHKQPFVWQQESTRVLVRKLMLSDVFLWKLILSPEFGWSVLCLYKNVSGAFLAEVSK